MRYNEWKARGPVCDPCNIPSKWWLRKVFTSRLRRLSTASGLGSPGPAFFPQTAVLGVSRRDNGLSFKVQRQDQMSEEGALEFWLPRLFLNHLPRSGIQVFRKGKG